MIKPRFTLRHLLGSVALVALAFGAIRCPTRFCVSLTLSVTLGVLVAALVAAATSRGALRAFCLGFAIAGWVHLILALTPWFAPGTSQCLLSRYCLDRLADPLGHAMPIDFAVEDKSLTHALLNYMPGSPPDRYYKYIVIGQSVFTLFFAAIGGLLGRTLHRLQLSCPPAATPTGNGPVENQPGDASP